MKVLICPDSFKGSLSASEFCDICEKEILKKFPEAEIDKLPLADGGEGTLDVLMKAIPGQIGKAYVQNGLYEEVEAPVGFFENGKTAVIEAAKANGLPLVKGRENPEETSTYGVGQMIAFALDLGAKKIILTLGGSCTNDCGLGMLAALGACFYNKDGVSFVPTGGTLKDVCHIDLTQMYPRMQGARFEAMCDVENPLCGENGCSVVFGPQKGADLQMVKRLDEGCRHVADLFNLMRETDYSLEKGAGAAGGLGFAVRAAFFGELKRGITKVLELCEFEKRLEGCDLLITGEGCFDSQSLMGKAVGGVLEKRKHIPSFIFCGCAKGDVNLPEDVKLVEISKGQKKEYAMTHAQENLSKALQAYL